MSEASDQPAPCEATSSADPSWRRLQAQASSCVMAALAKRNLWSPVVGPEGSFQELAEQLSPYFGLYPDSETLRAEFKSEFGDLDQRQRDCLFRLVKAVALNRDHLDSGPTPGTRLRDGIFV